jgi:hypothetical protein
LAIALLIDALHALHVTRRQVLVERMAPFALPRRHLGR